jgi:hypothetical protein
MRQTEIQIGNSRSIARCNTVRDFYEVTWGRCTG